MKRFVGLILFAQILQLRAAAGVVTEDVQKIPEGWLQVHHDSGCDTVVMIAVGTAMSVTDYQKLGTSIVAKNPSTVAIIVDGAPGNPVKNLGKPYAKLVNAIAKDTQTFVPSCSHTSQPQYLIGGHSSGGEGAVQALELDQMLSFMPAGFVGLAPYDLSNCLIDIPSLTIDFSAMSCAVNPNKAGRAAYSNSHADHRVFYQVETENKDPIFSGAHCSFTDAGCYHMCIGKTHPGMRDWMHDFVGRTIAIFQNAIVHDTFDNRDDFIVETGQYQVNLFVNQDSLPHPSLRIKEE